MLDNIHDKLTYLLRINHVTRETWQRNLNIKLKSNKNL
jgi:hypothetical protein